MEKLKKSKMENKKPKAVVKEKPFRKHVLNAILEEFKDDVKVVYSSDDRAIIKPLKRGLEIFKFIKGLDFDELIWDMGKKIPKMLVVAYKSKKDNRKQVLKRVRELKYIKLS